ncbi:MAG: NAD(P)/FAD-dependent oxidoreductase [Fidelibacterota bacterium]
MKTPNQELYDLIIVGAGPAGSTAALYAGRAGLKTLLVDKEQFPRDKICGDALSGKSVAILRELDLLEGVRRLPGAVIRTVTFGSPNHTTADIELSMEHEDNSSTADRSGNVDHRPTGFVIRREIFDNFLFQKARRAADSCLEEFSVREIVLEDGQVRGIRGSEKDGDEMIEYRGRMVIGADGFRSVVARKTGLYEHDPQHWVVALRGYYKNVKGLSHQIELHYIDEVIPGYFWIFPLETGYANVGIGMLHEYIKRKKVNLKEALQNAINSPAFRERFSESQLVGEPVGWNLPVGSKHRKIHGNGFMLLGDAAGLIDPFTGEGIGNAMYSARVAVEAACEACQSEDYSEAFLARYDERLWKAIGGELKLSTRLQQIGRLQFLLNFVIGKAARNEEVRNAIGAMITNELPREKLTSPMFYLKLLFS